MKRNLLSLLLLLCCQLIFAQSNDDCANAMSLNVNGSCIITDTFTNVGTTAEEDSIAPNPTCGFYQGGDVWFTFVMPVSGVVRIEIDKLSGPNPQYALYQGTCGSFSQIRCDQLDEQNTHNDPALAGLTLYLRVFGYNSASGGTFTLCLWDPPTPPNEDCTIAIPLNVGGSCVITDTFSNKYAAAPEITAAPNPTCGFYNGGDVWFSFVMPASGVLRVEIDKLTGAAPQYALYEGACGSLSQIRCDQLDEQNTVNDISLAGQTVLIRVFGYNSEEGGTFTLCLWEPNSPPNEDCSNAISLNVGAICMITDTFTNKHAVAPEITAAPNPTCGFYNGGDVWFSFVMPASGVLRVEIDKLTGAAPQYALYQGSCGSLSQIRCDQLDEQNTVSDIALAGQTVYIRVFGYNSEEGGTFTLCLFEVPAPPNEDCSNAIPLNVNSSCIITDTFTNVYAAAPVLTSAPNPTCGFYQGGDVWFSFTMPLSGELRVEIDKLTGASPQYALYSGVCGSLTQVRCDQLDEQNTVVDTSLAGQTVYVRVFGYNSEEGGTFTLCLWDPPVPVNDECANAITLPIGFECNPGVFTSAYATDDGTGIAPSPGCGFYRGGDVWFNFTMPQSGEATVDLDDFSGSPSTEMALYQGGCGNMTVLECGQLGVNTFFIEDPSLIGEDLYIRVFSYNSEEGGDFSICIFDTTCVPFVVQTDTIICDGETINFGNITISNAGTYNQDFLSERGCDSTVALTVNLLSRYDTIIQLTTCVLAEVDTVFEVYTKSNGCDSTITTITSILVSYEVFVDTMFCANDQIIFGDLTIFGGGLFTQTFTAETGCDSVVHLASSTLPFNVISLQEFVCHPDDEETIRDTFVNQFGCDSIIITNFTVYPDLEVNLDTVVCVGVNIIFGDLTIFGSGLFTQTFESSNGCDSVVHLAVSRLPAFSETILLTTCDPNQAGPFVDSLIASNGCDSIVTTITELLASYEVDVEATTCNPNQAGVSVDTFTAVTGCDSIVTTTTLLSDSYEVLIELTTCDPNSAGTTVDTLIASSNCDSIITTEISLLDSYIVIVEAVTCDPNGLETIFDTLQAVNGCDSVVISEYSLLNAFEILIDLTTCDPSQAETTIDTLEATTGCDSIITTVIELLPSYEVLVEETTCNPNEAGSSVDTFVANNGCDSIVTIEIELLESYEIIVEIPNCDGQGNGVEIDSLQASNGCDSIVIYQFVGGIPGLPDVEILECDTSADSYEYCIDMPLPELLNYDIFIDGELYLDFPFICDLDTLGGYDFTTVIDNQTYGGINKVLLSWDINGTNVVPAPFSYITFQELVDYLNILDLTGNWILEGDRIEGGTPPSDEVYGLIEVFSLDLGTASYTDYNVGYFGNGTLIEGLNEGCQWITLIPDPQFQLCADSIFVCFDCPVDITPDTIYHELLITETEFDVCPTADDIGTVVEITYELCEDEGLYTGVTVTTDPEGCVVYTAGAQPGNFVDTICLVGTDFLGNSDTTVHIFTIIEPCDDIEVTIEATTCYQDQAGTTIDTLETYDGCDSIVITITELLPSYFTEVEIGVCDQSQLETRYDTLQADNGCDSVIISIPFLLDSYFEIIEATTCDPEQAGTTIDSSETYLGCDSITTTITELLPSYITEVEVGVCDQSQLGIAYDTLQANNGCDSVIITVPFLLESYQVTIRPEVCDEDQTEIRVDTLVASNGCDSVITTIPILLDAFSETIDKETCNPDLAGTVVDSFETAEGCDSIITTITNLVEGYFDTIRWTTCNPHGVGEEIAVLTSSDGCDSTIVLIVTLDPECAIECETPQNLYVADVTFFQATIGWSPVPNAYAYRVEGRLRNGLFGITLSTVTLDTELRTRSLFPFLTYEFRVQADCLENDHVEWSDWSDWYSFTLNPFVSQRVGESVNPPNDLKEIDIFDLENVLTSYPNPSRGNVNVSFGVDEVLDAKVIVTDISGREVQTIPITLSGAERQQINLQNFSDGLYFFRFYKDGVLLSTEKILLNK